MKYSSFVSLYIDKLKSQASSEASWVATTTKLVILWVGALAYLMYIMKTKQSKVKPITKEEENELFLESDDEGNAIDPLC